MEKHPTRTPSANSAAPSLGELAASQGVSPVMDFDSLLGHPSSEYESVEEFAGMLRAWRSEGASPAPHQ